MNLNAAQLRALAFTAQNTGPLTLALNSPNTLAALPADEDDRMRTGWTTWGLFRADGSYKICGRDFAAVPAWVFDPETGEVRSGTEFTHPWGELLPEPPEWGQLDADLGSVIA